MKGNVKPSVIQMEEETFMRLVAEVKETVATDIELPKKNRSFGLVDLWNIRRNARSASSRLKR
jgi:ethanolamine utilization microcompartment shell protein EutL